MIAIGTAKEKNTITWASRLPESLRTVATTMPAFDRREEGGHQDAEENQV